MMPTRLADKAAMRILAISRAIKRGTPAPVPPPSPDEMTPIPLPGADAAPGAQPAPQTGAPLAGAPVDVGTVMQGGDMFDAIAKGASNGAG